MKRFLRLTGVLVAFIVLLSLYVFVTAGRHLLAARSVLTLSVEEVDEASAIEAETHLIQANRQLESIPARVLGLVPVARQNLQSLRNVTEAAIPTVRAAIDLQHAFARLEEEGLVESNRVNVALLAGLQEPVAAESQALERLVEDADAALNGWLLPPVWEQLHDLLQTATDLLDDVRAAGRILAESDEMLGADTPRSYLVLLMNNAELRGAGGVLTGVGSVHVDQGRIRLGRFRSVHALRDRPPQKVPAPSEFVRRFGTYKADTTLWLNATFSPDVPDVALVTSRLYEQATGASADGAVLIDPRGLAALVGPDTSFRMPRSDIEISGSELATFTYSEVYEQFDDQTARRAALLKLGEDAFESFISDPLVGRERLAAVGRAAAGGHIRLHSFEPDEAAALEEIGLNGAIEASEDARVIRLTQQNFGSANGEGTKLDFWTDRKVGQACNVEPDEARCRTRFTLSNDIPGDLPLYVAGAPYGILRTNVEIYLPPDAAISRVDLDGAPAEFGTDSQAGHQVVSVYLELEPDASAQLDLSYAMPVDDDFRLRLEPQPLARDARLDLAVVAPPGWTIDGEGRTYDREARWDRPIVVHAAPDRRTGLAAFWAGLMEAR